MGFYNVHEGDAPYLKFLADAYTMSDNYHQPKMGGTGTNHIMMGMVARSGSATAKAIRAILPQTTASIPPSPLLRHSGIPIRLAKSKPRPVAGEKTMIIK